MPTVTGLLTDFIPNQMRTGFAVDLVFVPSGPAVGSSGFITSRPIPVTWISDWEWMVDLVATEILPQPVWFTPKIEWLDAASNFTRVDFPDWKITIPPSGGNIKDLVKTAGNPFMVWTANTEPVDVPNGTFWLNPDTGDLKRKAA